MDNNIKEGQVAEDMIDWISKSIEMSDLANGAEKIKIAHAVIVMTRAYKLMKQIIGMNKVKFGLLSFKGFKDLESYLLTHEHDIAFGENDFDSLKQVFLEILLRRPDK